MLVVHVFCLCCDDLWIFGDFALVTVRFDPVVEARAQVVERVLMVWRFCEVFDFVGIGLQVVEFFVRAIGGEEFCLCFGEFAFFAEQGQECPEGVLLVFVAVELHVGAVRVIVAYVFVVFGAYTADAIYCAVTSVACRDDFAAGFCIGTEEDVAFHFRGDI